MPLPQVSGMSDTAGSDSNIHQLGLMAGVALTARYAAMNMAVSPTILNRFNVNSRMDLKSRMADLSALDINEMRYIFQATQLDSPCPTMFKTNQSKTH